MTHTRTAADKLGALVSGEDDQWRLHWQSLKNTVSGTPEQKEATLRKRVLKYFAGFKLDEYTHYNQRRDLEQRFINSQTLTPNILLLYGIDYLSPPNIKSHFAPQECQIRMVDYSHCLLTYANPDCLLQSLYVNLLHPAATYQQFAHRMNNNRQQLFQWRQIRGYQQLCFERQLWARFTTVEEISSFAYCQRKELNTYESAKAEFLDKIQKNHKATHNLARKQAEKVKQCRCQRKLNKLIEMLSQDFGRDTKYEKHWNGRKKRSPRQRQKERSRSRDRRQKRKYQLKLHPTSKIKPLQIIQDITEFDGHSNQLPDKQSHLPMLQNSTDLNSFLSAIPSQDQPQDDQLYQEMLNDLDRYHPFQNDQSAPLHASLLSKHSNCSYSVYDCASSEDEQQ